MPRISVVMPVYNAEKYLREAIDSILAQTYTDFEFIIIDDGSTDSSSEIVRSYTDKRIRFFQNEHNMGVAATLNRGLDLATGEYIARMDSDDISLPERFAKQVEYMDKHQECAVLGTSIIQFGADMEDQLTNTSSIPEYTRAKLMFHCSIIHPTVMMRRETLEKHHLRYNPIYNKIEDYELWWRVTKYGYMVSLPDVLLKYRIHPEQITQEKSEYIRQLHDSFIDDRMREFEICLTDEERKIYNRYCNEKCDELTYKEITKLFEVLENLVTNNRKKRVLENKALCKVTDDVVLTCLSSKKLSRKESRMLLGRYFLCKPSRLLAKVFLRNYLLSGEHY